MKNEVTQNDLANDSESVIENKDSNDVVLNDSQIVPDEVALQSNSEIVNEQENDTDESSENPSVAVQPDLETESPKPVFSFVDEPEIDKKDDEKSEIIDEKEIDLQVEIATEKEPEATAEQAEETEQIEETLELVSEVTDDNKTQESVEVEPQETNESSTVEGSQESVAGTEPVVQQEEPSTLTQEETPTLTQEETPTLTQEETPTLTQEETPTLTQEETENKEAIRSARQKYFDAIFSELKGKIGKKETVEVEVKARIRGGLRVHYKDIPLFLPTSHLILKKNPSEEYIQSFVGQKIDVFVHEFQEFDQGRKAVIVSRKKLLVKEMWEKIQVGDIVEGKISSIVPFGVFVDFDGLEGLIHVSQLSKQHIANPKDHFKKGQDIKARIIEIFKEKRKIGLSSKEFEDSAWKGIEAEFQVGMKVPGIVRRLTEFGAYVEIKPGIDGLLRNNELSWTKRGLRAVDMLNLGQTIDVEIVTISEEKENATLSYKRILPNPWPELMEKLKIDSEHEGKVLQVIPQGAVISLMKDVDGFMPRSKMKPFMKGNRIPFKSGDKLVVTITDLNVETQSLILTPKEQIQEQEARPYQDKKPQSKPKPSNESTFSLADMLSEDERKRLNDFNT